MKTLHTNFQKSVQLSKELINGSTCYTSRKKELSQKEFLNPKNNVPFRTLHSITHKILKAPKYADMEKLVDIILECEPYADENTEEKEQRRIQLRNDIRAIENGQSPTNPSLESIYKKYKQLKNGRYDWEDSLIAARNTLLSGSNYRLHYDNLVLVNYENLLKPSNNNALQFFLDLCEHLSQQGTNCYIMGQDFLLYQYHLREELFYPVGTVDTLPLALL